MSSLYYYDFVTNLYKLESLTPYTLDYNQNRSKDESRNAHKSTTQQQHTQTKERAHESLYVCELILAQIRYGC
jgi:hypothetical protein